MKVNFAGVDETVLTRKEFPLDKALEVLAAETVAVLGYGSQGPGQAQNLRDNGIPVIVGQRPGETYDKAIADGWIPGKTLVSLEEAAEQGTIIANLLSDAGQKQTWPVLRRFFTPGKAAYFSHGFAVHFSKETGIVIPEGVDAILVAPKGNGASLRENFLDNKRGINTSIAVERDATGHAWDRVRAMAIGIGSAYSFHTTFEREVVSDHLGERAFLLGQMWAIAECAYEAIKAREPRLGSSQTFIGSSEQLTQVILPLIGEQGITGIYRMAEAEGQLGTLVMYQVAVRNASLPVLSRLYDSVAAGIEAKIALDSNSDPSYRRKLNAELAQIDGSEMWTTGQTVRAEVKDRTYGHRITNWGLVGAVIGAMEAQYQILIDKGHSPSEAFNETTEESTMSLNRFYQRNGVAHLLGSCSTTAQRGSLDWGPKFKEALLPVFMGLQPAYTADNISAVAFTPTKPNMWTVGEVVRSLRP